MAAGLNGQGGSLAAKNTPRKIMKQIAVVCYQINL